MAQATATQPYLLVQVDTCSTVALVMNTIEQVATLRVRRLTPMPQMPTHVLGLFSRNSRAWWLVNLPALLGLASARPTQIYTVVALRSEGQALGLAVPEVKGVLRLTSENIQPMWGERLPFVKGYAMMQTNEVCTVLDTPALIQSCFQTTHPT